MEQRNQRRRLNDELAEHSSDDEDDEHGYTEKEKEHPTRSHEAVTIAPSLLDPMAQLQREMDFMTMSGLSVPKGPMTPSMRSALMMMGFPGDPWGTSFESRGGGGNPGYTNSVSVSSDALMVSAGFAPVNSVSRTPAITRRDRRPQPDRSVIGSGAINVPTPKDDMDMTQELSESGAPPEAMDTIVETTNAAIQDVVEHTMATGSPTAASIKAFVYIMDASVSPVLHTGLLFVTVVDGHELGLTTDVGLDFDAIRMFSGLAYAANQQISSWGIEPLPPIEGDAKGVFQEGERDVQIIQLAGPQIYELKNSKLAGAQILEAMRFTSTLDEVRSLLPKTWSYHIRDANCRDHCLAVLGILGVHFETQADPTIVSRLNGLKKEDFSSRNTGRFASDMMEYLNDPVERFFGMDTNYYPMDPRFSAGPSSYYGNNHFAPVEAFMGSAMASQTRQRYHSDNGEEEDEYRGRIGGRRRDEL